MLSLVDESDEKLFPHSLVLVENEEKIKKDIHCVKLKNGKPQKLVLKLFIRTKIYQN